MARKGRDCCGPRWLEGNTHLRHLSRSFLVPTVTTGPVLLHLAAFLAAVARFRVTFYSGPVAATFQNNFFRTLFRSRSPRPAPFFRPSGVYFDKETSMREKTSRSDNCTPVSRLALPVGRQAAEGRRCLRPRVSKPHFLSRVWLVSFSAMLSSFSPPRLLLPPSCLLSSRAAGVSGRGMEARGVLRC